jgi:DNA modification methylase
MDAYFERANLPATKSKSHTEISYIIDHQGSYPLSPGNKLKNPTKFDVQLANDLARLETYNKHHYRPNTYLHKWWARRCGTTFRLILKHLANGRQSRDYYMPGGLEGAIILDPMMGGGTTLHEAIRLGANCIGFDIDPIPVLQAKASLSATELPVLESAFADLYENLNELLAPLYKTPCPKCERLSPMRYMLYGQKRHCACEDVIVVDSLLLREESDKNRVFLCDSCHSVATIRNPCDCSDSKAIARLVTREESNCPRCGEPYRARVELPFYKRYYPVATMSKCPDHGSLFGSVDDNDRALLDEANQRRARFHFDESLKIEKGPKSSTLIQKGITNYSDLFSSRQILYLDGAINQLQTMDDPARLFLSLLVSTSLEFNSMLCGYKGVRVRRAGAIRHVFSHHAYSIPYTALEANPVFPTVASGTLLKLYKDRIEKARNWSLQPRERVLGTKKAEFRVIHGERDQGVEVFNTEELKQENRRFLVRQLSSVSLPLEDGLVDYIVTDPPYYDSVEYEDLSSFFRVWLKQMLSDVGSAEIDWDYRAGQESGQSWKNSGRNQKAERYLQLMGRIFSECRRVIRKDGGRLVFTFHHWDQRAWASLTLSLKRAGFELLEVHVVHSENPISVHIANMRALTDDAILVLAPLQEESSIRWVKPKEIDHASSAVFSRDCATLLGWMLNSDLDEGQIGYLWGQMLNAH